MKRAGIALVLLYALAALGTRAAAYTYTDDMQNLYADQVRTISGFSPHYYSGEPWPDYTVITPAEKPPAVARAEYRVVGAQTVTVYLYSPNATFVAYDEGMQKYRLGSSTQDMGLLQSIRPPQALLCPVSGEIYTLLDGLKWFTYDERMNLLCFEEIPGHAPPQGELRYGVNIYYSLDGQSYTRADAVLENYFYEREKEINYEAYLAQVPAEALYIRVEINGMQNLRYLGESAARPYVHNGAAGVSGLALAAVSIYGESLIPGVYEVTEPADAAPAPSPAPTFDFNAGTDFLDAFEDILREERELREREREREEEREYEREREYQRGETASERAVSPAVAGSAASSSAPSSRSEPEASSRASSASSSRAPSGTGGSRAASSKFEGVITIEPEEPWPPAAASPVSSAAGEQAPQAAPVPDMTAVEISPANPGETAFTGGVTVYIVLACAALAALALFKPRNKP